MSKEGNENSNGTAPQNDAVEDEILERLRREKAGFDEEAFEWGQEQAQEYLLDVSFLELMEVVEKSGIPKNWDDIREGAQDMGYDESEVVRGFDETVKNYYDRI